MKIILKTYITFKFFPFVSTGKDKTVIDASKAIDPYKQSARCGEILKNI